MQGITEQKTKAYFLGDLPDDDAFAFELETAASAHLTDFVRAVETALVDDFVAGRLSAGAAEKFTRVYLTTPARLERCRMAAGLRQLVAERTIKTPIAPSLSGWFEHNAFSRKKFVTFLVGLALLIGLGLVFWFSVNRSADPIPVAELVVADNPALVADSVPEESIQAERREPEEKQKLLKEPAGRIDRPNTKKIDLKLREIVKTIASKAGKVVSPPQSRSIVVKLMPGQRRTNSARAVTIAPDVDRVLVMLSPGGDPNRYRSLHAIVKTPEDKTVYSSPELNSLSFMISASRLENRTYVVTLEGKNGENRVEKIARYTFEIRR